eukprot:s2058_g14.t1
MQVYDVEEADFWRHRYMPVGSILEYSAEDPSLVAAGKISVLVHKVTSDANGLWLEVKPVECESEGFRKKFKSHFKGSRRHHHICYVDAEDVCPLASEQGVHLTKFSWFPPGDYAPPWMTKAGGKLAQSGLALHRAALRDEADVEHGPERRGESETERRLNRLKSKGTGRVSFAPRGESPVFGAPDAGRSGTTRAGVLRKPRDSDYALAVPPGSRPKVKTEIVLTDSEPEISVKEEKKKKKVKKGVADTLAQAVAVRQNLQAKTAATKKKRSRSRSRNRDRRKRSRRKRSSSKDSSEDGSSAESSDASLQPPLKKRSEKDPGSVFKLLLSQAADQLAQEGLDQEDVPSNLSSGQKVKLYTFYQLALKPHLDLRSRDNKELALLAKALDLLQEGDLPRLADLLSARMIAVETATRQGWQTAKFLELQSLDDDGTAPPHILLAAQRHSRQVEKAGGKGSWSKSFNWYGEWGGENRAKGRGKEPKGKGKKGKGKPKGGKGGWNQWGGDKPKPADKDEKPAT